MLKAGMIGMGRMGVTHFSILNSHPLAAVSAVCDQSRTMLNFFERYAGVKTFSDYRAMLDSDHLDCVLISTPSDSHAELIQAAIRKGLHIFVEKPLALDLAEGKRILELVQGKSLVNQVGYVNRFNEVFAAVKDLLVQNAIGQIKYFKCEMSGSTVTRNTSSSWRSKRNLGGGCMYEFASHCIDLAVFLMGMPDEVKGSTLQRVFSTDVEDIVSTTFVYDKGCMGNVIVNWSDLSARKPVNRIEIIGKEGKIIADKHSFKIYLKSADTRRGFHPGWNTRSIAEFSRGVHHYVRGNEFSLQLAYFIDHIATRNTENIAGFAEAWRTDTVIDRIMKNSTEVR